MKQTALEFYRSNLMALVSTGKTDFKTEPEIFNQAKEMEKQQSDDYAIEFAEWCRGNYDFIKKEDYTILLKKFKKEKGL